MDKQTVIRNLERGADLLGPRHELTHIWRGYVALIRENGRNISGYRCGLVCFVAGILVILMNPFNFYPFSAFMLFGFGSIWINWSLQRIPRNAQFWAMQIANVDKENCDDPWKSSILRRICKSIT